MSAWRPLIFCGGPSLWRPLAAWRPISVARPAAALPPPPQGARAVQSPVLISPGALLRAISWPRTWASVGSGRFICGLFLFSCCCTGPLSLCASLNTCFLCCCTGPLSLCASLLSCMLRATSWLHECLGGVASSGLPPSWTRPDPQFLACPLDFLSLTWYQLPWLSKRCLLSIKHVAMRPCAKLH